MSQHEIRSAGRTKSGDLMATVNDAVVPHCAGKLHVLIWGGPASGIGLTGDRLNSSEALDDQALALPESIVRQRANMMETDSAVAGNRFSD